MGVAVSQAPMPRSTLHRRRQWTCPRCLTVNSSHMYPRCFVCSQENSETIEFPSPTSLWRCNGCLIDNPVHYQHCQACGKRPGRATNHQTRVTSAMRPSSVSIYKRREMDETHAEKISHDILRYCRKAKIVFVDDRFPPSSRSLGDLYADRVFQWLSYANTAPSSDRDAQSPWRIYSSPQPRDIQQGFLGDCWLMTALALITERPQMLEHILLTKTINPEGVFVVRICHNGIWKTVLLDGYFPCTAENRLVYAQAIRRQLFGPLIEKACAKLFGSYESLRGGTTAEGLQLLTGAACECIDLDPLNDMLDYDTAWLKILSACESKLLIGAATSGSPMDEHHYHRVGLSPNHAFGVLKTTSLPVGNGRFLLVRDPHGVTQFSDDSISSSDRHLLHKIHAEALKSGIFWISWENFLHYFDSVTISTYVSDHFDIREVGRFTQSATEMVPTYYFTVTEISLITVSLAYHRERRKADKEHAQSFVLCNIDEERSEMGTKEVILSSRRGTFNHWSGSLRPGVYAVMPFSTRFWGRQDRGIRDYSLVIHSSIQLNGVWVNEPATLLADCLIAATIKYCTKPKRDLYSVLYTTLRRQEVELVVVENQLVDHHLHCDLTIANADHIRHSRQALHTRDCVPPRHRQLLCILEWTDQANRVAHMCYSDTEVVHDTPCYAIPVVRIDQGDLHSPRPF